VRTLKNFSKEVSVRNFSSIHNKILIVRDTGGLGDILMHRMLFEDFKKQMPSCHLTFACPKAYFEGVSDHLYLDDIVDSREVNENDYGVTYNTTTICGKYEMATAPNCDKHRSDIWANHCGLELSNHSMHLNLTSDEIAFGSKKLRAGKNVIICPKSAMVSKDLDREQIKVIVEFLKKHNLHPILLHTKPLGMELCEELHGLTIRQWLAILYNSDAVISVDTAAFHAAGGLGKPLLGVFTWSDGLIYGRFFDLVLIQKHRNLDKNWTCGPCYKWFECPKLSQEQGLRKPCATEISREMLEKGLTELLDRFGI